MAKVIKHKFSLDFEAEFELVGISTHHADFRLAFVLNEKLGISLEKVDDFPVVLKGKKNEAVMFSRFKYIDPDDHYQLFLLKNKSEGKVLVSEKPTIDFFLFIYDNYSLDLSELVNSLREIQIVLAAYEFDPEELESTHNINLV